MDNTDIASYFDYLQRLGMMPGTSPLPPVMNPAQGGTPTPIRATAFAPTPTDTPPVQPKPAQTAQNQSPAEIPPPPPTYDVPPEPRLGGLPQPSQFGLGANQNPASDFEVFKNPIVVLATLGSLFTRTPLISAMNAATGAMNGFHEGKDEIFKQNKEKFNEALVQAMDQNKLELEKYNIAWDRKDVTNWNKNMPQLWAEAAANKDEIMMNAIKQGPAATEKLFLLREQSKALYDRAKALSEIKGSPQAVALHRFLEENPDATAEQINAFIQGGRAGRSALTMYMQRYLSEHPDATADDVKKASQQYQTETTAQNRFLSGPQGNTIRSLNVVVSHLETMRGLADALQNRDVQRFNQLAQSFAAETGQPAPTNFDTAKQIVGTEIIKALGVAGAGTENERREAADGFMRARSPEQIYGAIQVVQALLGGQLKGLRRQFTTSTGLPGERFDEMLELETIRSLRADSKPVPTDEDRNWVKKHPEDRQKFINHFGIEP